MFSNVCYDDISKNSAILYCLSFAVLYVGSLYVRSKQLPRDHPKTIRERMLRVTIASISACFIAYYSSSFCSGKTGATFLQWIGIRWEGLLYAMLLPSFLILLLFLGPIIMFLVDHGLYNVSLYSPYNIMFWRNYFVAPLSEELVFRGFMLPILVPTFGTSTSIFLAPWFFGLAHIHHAYEQYKVGSSHLSSIAISTIFQASYTTVFGILSSFIFLRTGHLISPFLSHSICNMMGFPDFDQALSHRRRYFVCTSFVLGLLSFLVLLRPLTEPSLFYNHVYTDV